MRERALFVLAGTLLGLTGCPPPPSAEPAKPKYESGKLVFAVLPADAPAFPIAARAATERLRRARVRGYDQPEMSKVSINVVQLQIECVDQIASCYEKVGKELGANQLLFAEIDQGPRKGTIKVTVTLFDVDSAQRKRAASKVFSTEEDVVWGVGDVIDEATKLEASETGAAKPQGAKL